MKWKVTFDNIERLKKGYPFNKNLTDIVEAESKQEAIENARVNFPLHYGYGNYRASKIKEV